MSEGFLVFKAIWGSQGCRDLRGQLGPWAPREVQVSLELRVLKECEVHLVCQVSRETQDYQASMEMTAPPVCPASPDAMAPRETEEETALLVFLVGRVLLVSQDSLERRATLVV